MQAERTDLHPTAVKVLKAVAVTEERATNHLEWIADEAGVSDSTVSRWLRRMEAQLLVARYEQDWIWCDRHVYWRLTWKGEEAIA